MPDDQRRPTARAQELRTNATGPERLLWNHLRGSQLDGFKFSRQIPIGPFIADFVCRSQRLVVELDGDTHSGREAADAARTRYIEAQGYRVIRFYNNQVTQNVEWVLGEIRACLPDRPSYWGKPIGRGAADLPRRRTGVEAFACEDSPPRRGGARGGESASLRDAYGPRPRPLPDGEGSA